MKVNNNILLFLYYLFFINKNVIMKIIKLNNLYLNKIIVNNIKCFENNY